MLVTFRLQDIDVPNNWTNNLGTVTFAFVVGRASYSFANNSPILINDSTNASPYASIIQVSNVVGNITKVTVSINNLSHAFPADIDMLLVNPAGQATILMSDAGGGFPVNSINLSFDDARTNTLPANAPMVSGIYKPTNHMEYIYGIPSVDWFPLPAPPTPWGEGLSALASGNPNGAWQLFVVDDLGGEAGNIAGGWTLNLVTSDSGSSSADLSVVASDDADPVLIGRNVTYTLAVTNHGPSMSTGVYLTNYLPANVTFISCSGAYVRTNNMVIVNLGTIGSGFGRAINLVVQPTEVGTVGVIASVVGSQMDMNLNNNTREVLTDVIPSPTVFMSRKDANSMTISWIAAATGFVLESTESLNPPRWEAVPGTVTPSGGMLTITVNTAGTNRFFRLRQP